MPFTGTHPVAVLPFLRTRLPPSALVIGTITPDIPYFLPGHVGTLPLRELPTHTAIAAPTLDLVIGLLVWAVWHGFLAAPALYAAARPLRARLQGQVCLGLTTRLRQPRGMLLVAVALLVGVATHLAWDSVTHPATWGATQVAVLREPWHGHPGYRWVQYASDVVGMPVLVGWLARWLRRNPPRTAAAPRAPWTPWLLIGGAGVVAAGSGLLSLFTGWDLREAVFRVVTHAGAAGFAVAVWLSGVWHWRYGRGRLRG